jgi:regulator of sigma E protease
MVVTVLVFLLILSVLVLVHELGHFLVAKKLGVKVEEFGFGFPPRIYGKQVGETMYSLNLLPIGGFVKLYGEDDAGGGKVGSLDEKVVTSQKNIKRAFFARPIWQRGSIVVAGVVMNFLLAFVLISYLFAVAGVSTPGTDVQVMVVAPHSPAQTAGLQTGAVIKSIDGHVLTSPNQLISYTKSHLGKEVTLVVAKNGQEQTIQLTPRVHYPANEGAMGVAISNNVITKRYPWYEAPFVGLKESFKETWMIVQGLWMTVSTLIVSRQVPQDVAGPVGIAQLTGQFIKIGPNAVLSLVSLLSLNLAVLNILPIPALDGGRFFFILLEAITRKKVDPRVEGYAHAAGMVGLLILIALITLHDLVRVVTGQPILPK